MRFSLTTALLATTALTSPVKPRDELVDSLITAQTLISDINNIHQGVLSLDKHVQAYNGNPLSETPLIGDFTAIHLANRKGFADANLRQSPFNASDSHDIVQFTIDTVGESIPAAVESTKERKPLFEKSGQNPIIVGTLEVLLNDHDTFSAALVKKISADFERADAVVAKIHNAIQSGIDYFST